MTRAALSLKDFHAAADARRKPVHVEFKLADTSVNAETRAVSFVFSDDSIDSYGDTIDAKGWQWDKSAGTVALFGHDASRVENVIGRAHNVRIEGNKLIGDIHFASAEVNPQAEAVFQLVKGGYLNSVSVGFQPIEWKLANDKARPGGIDFKKQKLLEISVVPIPANENAIALARAAGISVDALRWEREAAPVRKGLWEVSWLAGLLDELSWLEECVEWEAEYEGDGSDVPARLAMAMQVLGQILLDMTAEEVAELLSEETDEPAAAPVLMSGASEAQRAKLIELVRRREARAGKVLSAANESKLRAAYEQMAGACDTIRGMLEAIAENDADESADKSVQDDALALRARKARALKLLAAQI